MALGTSIFLIAAGAILAYAVDANLDFIDINTVGTILLVIGVLGLALSLILIFTGRRDREAVEEVPVRERYRDPRL